MAYRQILSSCNRAGCPNGKILTEVVITDRVLCAQNRGQDTVNKMLIIWQTKQILFILLANGDELNLNLLKFARPLNSLIFSHQTFWHFRLYF